MLDFTYMLLIAKIPRKVSLKNNTLIYNQRFLYSKTIKSIISVNLDKHKCTDIVLSRNQPFPGGENLSDNYCL